MEITIFVKTSLLFYEDQYPKVESNSSSMVKKRLLIIMFQMMIRIDNDVQMDGWHINSIDHHHHHWYHG